MKPMNRRPWRPLLDGTQRETACAIIEEVARALDVGPESLPSAALVDGAAGRAIFFAYLGDAWPGHGYDERAAVYLEHAIDELSRQQMSEALYVGFAGIAWTFEHLQGRFVEADEEDPNLSLDETLHTLLDKGQWDQEFDLIRGLAGLGVYALERLPRAIAAKNLSLIVERLTELAVERDGGLTWLSKPELMIPETRAEHPHGYFNLGVAHGVPGVVAILAGACAAGVVRHVAQPLLDGAWRWMMANRLTRDAETTFPYWVRDGAEPNPTRNAWCYGDPGAATTLYWAARAVGNDAWARQALAIASRSADRPVERSGCVDAGLCHGTGGLALIYNRLWQETGDERFAETARLWCGETFKLRRPGIGLAGYESYIPRPSAPRELVWTGDPSFLTGTAGMALSLLAAVSSVEPAWDRVLLTSLPPSS